MPAGLIEEKVVDEVVKILKSHESIMHVHRLAEQNSDIDRQEMFQAVKNLNEAWAYLYPNEQRKIINMLVEPIYVQNGVAKLKLNLDGLNRLLFEVM